MKSYIYIITNGEDYKVGVSVNPQKRLKQLQTGNSKKLSIVNTFEVPADDVYKMEKEAHKEIQICYEKRGEWFKKASAWHINVLVDKVYQKFVKEE
jgi:hypothetical protein